MRRRQLSHTSMTRIDASLRSFYHNTNTNHSLGLCLHIESWNPIFSLSLPLKYSFTDFSKEKCRHALASKEINNNPMPNLEPPLVEEEARWRSHRYRESERFWGSSSHCFPSVAVLSTFQSVAAVKFEKKEEILQSSENEKALLRRRLALSQFQNVVAWQTIRLLEKLKAA